LKHRETQFGFTLNTSFALQAEIAIAFALGSLLKGTRNDAQGVGEFCGHVEKRGRACHCFPGSRGVFWVFEYPKSESAPH
jgi:hypothetical protein